MIQAFFEKNRVGVYGIAMMARMAIYAYLITIHQLWGTVGWWSLVGAGFLYVTALIGGTMKPNLLAIVATLIGSCISAILVHFSVSGVDIVSASVLVVCAMITDGVLSVFVMMFGVSE